MKENAPKSGITLCEDHVYFDGMHLTYRLLLLPGEVMHRYFISVSLAGETCQSEAGKDLSRALGHYQRIREGIVTPCALEDVMQELQYA